jgi:hypothetical protein
LHAFCPECGIGQLCDTGSKSAEPIALESIGKLAVRSLQRI